ncbi:MAG: hypothetical protein Q8873_04870, partial [Bacillota bacterium]|nr:hypothetical protein [Bacillota bacterium]
PITVPAGNDVTIPDGITLTFGKGNETNAYISVEGNLNISGVKLSSNITNYVNIFPSGDGKFSIKDSEIIKPKLTVDSATGCTFRNTSPGQYIISKQLNTSRFLGFGDCTYPAYITANTINTCLFDKCGSHITAQSLILSVFKDCENSSVSGVISAFTNNSFLSKLSFINTQGDAFAASDNYWNGVSYIDVLDMFSDPSLINTDRLLSVPSQDCYPFVYKYTSSVDEYNANFKIILYYNNSLSVLPTVTAEAYGVSNASYNLTVSGSDGCYTALGNFVGTYSSADFSVSGGISLGVVPAELSGIAPVKLTGYELYTDIVATKSSVTINLRNNSPTTKQYFFTVAQYSGGKLICINMSATTTIGGYKNAIINPVFSLAMNTDTVKIFLANRIGRLSPYIPATVFTNLQ